MECGNKTVKLVGLGAANVSVMGVREVQKFQPKLGSCMEL